MAAARRGGIVSRTRPRGQVLKRGSRWTVILSEVDPVSGQRVRRYHSGFVSKGEAEKARTRLLAEMDRGEYVKPSKVLVSDYLADWLTGRSDQLQPTTLDSYRSQIQDHVVPALGGLYLTGVNPMRILKFYAELRASGRKRGGGGLSPATVLYIHRILRRSFADAVRRGLLASNPFDRIDPPRPARDSAANSMNTWTAQQVSGFLDSVTDDWLYALWHLAATTGMRRGELLGLRWTDVDTVNRRVEVTRSRVTVRYETAISSPKSKSGYRSVALDEVTASVLKKHRAKVVSSAILIGRSFVNDELIFCHQDGTPVHPDQVSKSFKRLSKRASLPEIRFHDLRHTYATLALRADVHPKVVSERLGHSTIAMTLDRYSHAVPALQEDAAETVARLIAGGNK